MMRASVLRMISTAKDSETLKGILYLFFSLGFGGAAYGAIATDIKDTSAERPRKLLTEYDSRFDPRSGGSYKASIPCSELGGANPMAALNPYFSNMTITCYDMVRYICGAVSNFTYNGKLEPSINNCVDGTYIHRFNDDCAGVNNIQLDCSKEVVTTAMTVVAILCATAAVSFFAMSAGNLLPHRFRPSLFCADKAPAAPLEESLVTPEDDIQMANRV